MVVEPKPRKRITFQEILEVAKPSMTAQELVAELRDRRRAPRTKPCGPPGSISLSEAARRYGVRQSTLSRWVPRFHIPIVLETANEKFVDEAVLLAYIRKYLENPGRGKKTVLDT
jgi:hypothetical protein